MPKCVWVSILHPWCIYIIETTTKTAGLCVKFEAETFYEHQLNADHPMWLYQTTPSILRHAFWNVYDDKFALFNLSS
jgi:hypothetical protein